MTPRKIQIGILGSGGYGGTARGYFRNSGQFNTIACMDIDPATALQAASEESAKSYTELDEFLAHPGLEAVSINTPALCHAEHSLRCLEAGKHVFVTKPITARLDEAITVAQRAKETRLVYMVGHHARYMPPERFAAEIVRSGKLGRVCNALITSCSSAGLFQQQGDWRVEAGRNPGGPLLQCGIHSIDFLLGLFGHVTAVSAFMQEDVTPFDVVDNALTLLRFHNGVQVSLVCNYTTAYLHTMDFFGTEGNLHVHQHVTGLGRAEVWFQPRGSGEHEPWQPLDIPLDPSYPDPHRGILERQFADQIRADQPDYHNLEDAVAALRIVHAAVESHRSGRALEIDHENV